MLMPSGPTEPATKLLRSGIVVRACPMTEPVYFTHELRPATPMPAMASHDPFESELDLLAETGTAVAHCPVSNAKLACGGPLDLRAMRSRGIRVGLGTDGTISNNALSQWETMKFGSLCALGGLIPLPVESALRYFPEDFARPLAAAGHARERHPWR